MENPWVKIKLSDYESHMKLDNVMQLQALNGMMKTQFKIKDAKSILILGVAGGNGLEHIDLSHVEKVYGIDINADYLNECQQRYKKLNGIAEYLCEDLTEKDVCLPYADLVIANLFIEYIGYDCFQNIIKKISPLAVSCIIQVNMDESFVSNSPYIHAFDKLIYVHHNIEETKLSLTMKDIGYGIMNRSEQDLPNGKKLIQFDFAQYKHNPRG